jgi:hypothetical protein
MMKLVSAMRVKSFCGLGTGTVREPKARGTSTVGSRCQKTCEGLRPRACLVNCRDTVIGHWRERHCKLK